MKIEKNMSENLYYFRIEDLTTLNILELLIVFLGMILIIMIFGFHQGYKTGQKEALKGSQDYQLVEFEDGTRKIINKQNNCMKPYTVIK